MEGASATEVKVSSKFPGLNQAISNQSDNNEVIVDVPVVVETPAPKEGEPGYVAPTEVVVEETATPPVETPAFNPDALSDEEFDAILKKRTGKSLVDLNPPVVKSEKEIAEEKEQRKNEALAYALENKILTKADYDKKNAILAKPDRELALQRFTENLQAEDKDLTPDECEEIFNDTYHQGEDASDRMKGIGGREIKKLAESIRNENSLPDFESEYENTLQTQGQYKAYKGLVKEAAGEIPKELSFSVEFEVEKGKPAETFNYKFPVDEKILNKIISDYSTGDEFSVRNIKSNGKIDKKAIVAEMNDRIKAKLFDTAIPELLKNNAADVAKSVMAKVKNIPVQQTALANGQQNVGRQEVKVQARPGLHQATENQRN